MILVYIMLNRLNRISLIRHFSTGKQRTAIYAGTFDPPTSGHLDIMTRGLSLCDKLYVKKVLNSL